MSSEKVVNKLCQIASARKLIEFEKRQMKASDDHLYVGTPSQEVDDAWIRLIHGLFHFGKGVAFDDDALTLIEHCRVKFQSRCN